MNEKYAIYSRDYYEHKYLNQFFDSDEYKKLYYCRDKETDEEKVIRIIKGDFEYKFGMTFDKFQDVLKSIMINNPEKLI